MPLFILSPHLFFCILLAFQYVLDYVAGDRSKRKGQKLPLDTGIHYCWVSYMMPKWVTPITVCSPEPWLSLKSWTVISARPTAEQESSSEIHPVGLRQMSENIIRCKKGWTGDTVEILTHVFVSLGSFKCVEWFWVFGFCRLLLRFHLYPAIWKCNFPSLPRKKKKKLKYFRSLWTLGVQVSLAL